MTVDITVGDSLTIYISFVNRYLYRITPSLYTHFLLGTIHALFHQRAFLSCVSCAEFFWNSESVKCTSCAPGPILFLGKLEN